MADAFYVFNILSRVANSWLDSWKNWLNHKRIIADAFVANFKMRSHAEIRGFVHYVSKSEYRSSCRVEKKIRQIGNSTTFFCFKSNDSSLLFEVWILCMKLNEVLNSKWFYKNLFYDLNDFYKIFLQIKIDIVCFNIYYATT